MRKKGKLTEINRRDANSPRQKRTDRQAVKQPVKDRHRQKLIDMIYMSKSYLFLCSIIPPKL